MKSRMRSYTGHEDDQCDYDEEICESCKRKLLFKNGKMVCIKCDKNREKAKKRRIPNGDKT